MSFSYRYFIVIGLICFNAFSHSVYASSLNGGSFGAGLVLGEPTGLSGKLWVGHLTAVDFGLAFSFNSYLLVFSDYLWHFSGVFGRRSTFATQLQPYIGVGGMIASSSDGGRKHFFSNRNDLTAIGLRIPFGIEWRPSRPSLGVFFELVPGMFLIPGTEGSIGGGVGVRYYF
jgi:hypothetical protein